MYNKVELALIIVFFVAIGSCSEKKNILEIKTGSDITDHSNILFLVESANVPILEDSIELKRFFTPDQLSMAFDSMVDYNSDLPVFRKWVYKDYGTVIKTKNYQTDLLLLIDNTKNDRFYKFSLNYFDHNKNQVGYLDFATWTKESHYGGNISADTIVEIRCYETDEFRKYKISENGEFILIDSR